MRFREAHPLLPSFALAILVGGYLWIDGAAEKHSRPVAAQSVTTGLPAEPDAQLAAFQQTVSTSHEDPLARLQRTVQDLQSSNKSLSEQVGTLAARLDDLEKARAEARALSRHRARRRF